jgi:hypothetical protein
MMVRAVGLGLETVRGRVSVTAMALKREMRMGMAVARALPLRNGISKRATRSRERGGVVGFGAKEQGAL